MEFGCVAVLENINIPFVENCDNYLFLFDLIGIEWNTDIRAHRTHNDVCVCVPLFDYSIPKVTDTPADVWRKKRKPIEVDESYWNNS